MDLTCLLLDCDHISVYMVIMFCIGVACACRSFDLNLLWQNLFNLKMSVFILVGLETKDFRLTVFGPLHAFALHRMQLGSALPGGKTIWTDSAENSSFVPKKLALPWRGSKSSI
jgi:hypothetical protein